jgi:hypothetical protein
MATQRSDQTVGAVSYRDLASPTPPNAMLTLNTLVGAALTMSDGPTGRSYYWPEYFATLHPDFATTDVSFNRVDSAWLSSGDHRAWLFLEAEPTSVDQAPVADALHALRERVGLPAVDLAAMIGVQRRQLYNLLRSRRASAERERWIHVLAAQFERVAEAADEDTARIRAATLTPLADGSTLYDRAVAHDEVAVRAGVDDLVGLLGEGKVSGLARRPSPALKRRAGSASEFLSGYRDQGS